MRELQSQQEGDAPQRLKLMSAGKAVLLGHLFVNLPVLLLIVGFSVAGKIIVSDAWLSFLVIGSVLAWTWWSFSVPRWRRWALERGASPDRLQKLAVATGLVWPKGWIPEKTEFKLSNPQHSTERKLFIKRRKR